MSELCFVKASLEWLLKCWNRAFSTKLTPCLWYVSLTNVNKYWIRAEREWLWHILEGFVYIWVDLNTRGGSCKCCLPQHLLKETFDASNFLWLNTPMHRLEDQSAVVVLLWPDILHDYVTVCLSCPKSRSGHVFFKHVISFWKLQTLMSWPSVLANCSIVHLLTPLGNFTGKWRLKFPLSALMWKFEMWP